MKPITITILLLTTTFAFSADPPTPFIFWAQAQREAAINHNLNYLATQRALQMQSIYTAYPQNPALYRYLQRNPRYIDLYLGK